MVNSIEHNAYRILGLDVTTSQKEILKRYKEIINHLKIDDYPEYDLDILLPKKFRSESAVTDALKRLQSQKNNLKEYFFWFKINDKVDEKALKYLQNRDFAGAIETWKNASKSNSSTSLSYKKNLALMYCLLLIEKNNKTYLKDSLLLWHEILNSDNFWKYFLKTYELTNDLINSEAFTDFRKNVVKQVSDVYTDLHKVHKDNKFIKDFQETFKTHGEKTEKNLLQPVYQSIYDNLEDIQKIKITDDEGLDEKEIKKIDNLVDSIKVDLDKLEDMGSYDNDSSIVVRDNVSTIIRGISVALYNHTKLLDDSSRLLKTAIKICGTESLRSNFEEDLKQIKKNEKSIIDVEISGFFSSKTASFNTTYLVYKGKKMFYRDIEWVSYIATSHSINGIPTGTTYKFNLTAGKDEIALSPGEEEWNKLVNFSKQLIEPLLIQKIVRQIFEKNTAYVIGGIKINKEGYSRDKFWGGTDQVLWGDRIFIPTYHAGNVVLFKEKNGEGRQFTQVSMSEGNSVILPELIPACVEYYQVYGKIKRSKKEKE